jgi:catechol 2,3-dioxygenase-like lactoylglutathione lyase family enzyme
MDEGGIAGESLMNIQKVELLTTDLQAQRDYYNRILELPTQLTSSGLHIQAGETEILFLQAPPGFEGAYHFAFNIPENQYSAAKKWITSRIALLHDKSGSEDFNSKSWNSDSLYFLDAAGNVLEFIARHTLQNAVKEDFDSQQILSVSEIGLPSEDVIGLANEICTRLGVSVYRQEPSESFTPVGDENGLFILPIQGRIWMPDSGVPARMLPVKVWGTANGREWNVSGVPYEIRG